MAFAKKGGKHKSNQQNQKPRRKPQNRHGQGNGSDGLLYQLPGRLDHYQPIGCLHASALESVVKSGFS